MKKCPNCGRESDSKYCPDCGSEMQEIILDEKGELKNHKDNYCEINLEEQLKQAEETKQNIDDKVNKFALKVKSYKESSQGKIGNGINKFKSFIKKPFIKLKEMSLIKKVLFSLVLIAIIVGIVVAYIISSIVTLADNFDIKNGTNQTLQYLDFKTPKDWVEEKRTEDLMTFYKEEGNVIGGMTIKYLGDENLDITKTDIFSNMEKDIWAKDDFEIIEEKNDKILGADKSIELVMEPIDNSLLASYHSAVVVVDKSKFYIEIFQEKYSIDTSISQQIIDEIDFENYKTVSLSEIVAEYKGETTEGTVINEESDIIVTAKYDNDTSEAVVGWTLKPESIKLKADQTSTITVEYGGKKCELKIQCSTISEKKYKSMCKNYSYDSIARYPDDYMDKYIKLSGKVLQDGGAYYRIAKDGNYDNVVYVNAFLVNKDGGKILEGDYVTVYGTCGGEKTYTSIMGASITIPLVMAKYIDR